MDKLAFTARCALLRGMSYGRYMALPKHERQAYEEQMRRTIVLDEAEGKKTYERECAICGATFIATGRQHNKLYCSDQCNQKAFLRRRQAYYNDPEVSERLRKQRKERYYRDKYGETGEVS